MDQQQNVEKCHPFWNLPLELIWDILDLLPPEAIVRFAFASYPMMIQRGLAPTLSRVRLLYLAPLAGLFMCLPFCRLPTELMLEVVKCLKPADLVCFTIANYRDLAGRGIAPPLTDMILQELKKTTEGHI
ncbi:hypothetical protein K470DRAFT_272301 [Piedraia hortae CBS 480.64]|uniref:F-box domain-containing protein n=1 Tax=Piedraia hortae CBS 480.64 TaxID=1314780 RepID=A0A6A7BTH3_9PEZI|nr:hypothetical protein K470DRAFT_272301 [Piedraia hortae CBS 480.64]